MKGVKTTEMQVLYESAGQSREKAITNHSQNEKFRTKKAVDRILNREVQASTDIGVNKEFNIFQDFTVMTVPIISSMNKKLLVSSLLSNRLSGELSKAAIRKLSEV